MCSMVTLKDEQCPESSLLATLATRTVFGLGRRVLAVQLRIVLYRQHESGSGRVNRHGEALRQQVIPQDRTDVVRKSADEAAQLYAVNTP